MRFLHTADWHIGKKMHGYALLEEQQAAFEQIEQIARAEKVDAIVIAGDLYDRAVPASDSVALLNQQLEQLNLVDQWPLLAISGNHDSAVRLGSSAPWYHFQNFFMQTTVAASFQPVKLAGVEFFLLPYFEIFEVQQLFPEAEINDLSQAVALVVTEMQKHLTPGVPHVLVSHFFAAGAATSDSETKVQVGGLAAIPVTQLELFDYVALGHLHNPGALHHEKIRYSGSPLAFSLSEAQQTKGVVIVDITENKMTQTFIPLTPRHRVVEVSASFAELKSAPEFLQYRDDFIGINLTDTKVIPNVMGELKKIYPRLLQIKRQTAVEVTAVEKKVALADPLTVFADFFTQITQETLSDYQEKIVTQSYHALKEE